MKLKVIGSGSSGNCYLLEDEKETLILECGLPYKTIIKGLNFNLTNVVGCLVTHEHKDHSKAIFKLGSAGIDIYLSCGTLNSVGDGLGYRAHFIKSERQFTIGGFTILPFQTQHDAAEPLGFLIQHEEMGKMLFITDSYYCKYKFKGLSHILVECNYSMEILNKNIGEGLVHPVLANRLLKSHFNLENVKEFLKATDLAKVKDIVLLHLSDGNSNAAKFKNQIERLTGKPTYIANKELEIQLF